MTKVVTVHSAAGLTRREMIFAPVVANRGLALPDDRKLLKYRACIHALVNEQVNWFRATHFSVEYRLGIFNVDGTWLATWEPWYGWDVLTLAMFKAQRESERNHGKKSMVPRFWLDVVKQAEDWIVAKQFEGVK
jgi:hypothetical protein